VKEKKTCKHSTQDFFTSVAKPVIESLTPMLPTFGYGKAVVKKV